jgi:hypothetical protein
VLRITTIETQGERRLVLEGRLIEPWITEFKKAWQEASQALNDHRLVIDLANVTVISPEAESLLLEIRREGAQFVCDGVLNKHLVRQIERRCKRKDATLGCWD